MTVNTLETPFTITGIPVSQTDPQQTCSAIESWFQQAVTSFTTSEAPVWFQSGAGGVSGGASYLTPLGPITGFEPTLSVEPVVGSNGHASLTQFDVTFGGTSSYRDEAPIVISSVVDENGDPLNLADSRATILKQSSPEFQVNPPTQQNIFSLNPVVYNAGESAVAMDATGDFVITWQGQGNAGVPGTNQSGSGGAQQSYTEIFARRYEPIGITSSYAPGTYVPGQVVTGVEVLPSPSAVDVQQLNFSVTKALPVTGVFQLQMATEFGPVTTGNISFTSASPSTTASNIQKALVAAGFTGVTVTVVPTTKSTNFFFKVTFGGACTGVDESPLTYVPNVHAPLAVTFAQKNINNINSVEPVSNPADMYTFLANTITANPHDSPAVSMDEEGDFTIAWASEGQTESYFNDIYLQRFNYTGNRVGSETLVNTEVTANDFVPAVAMGRDGYVVVTWSETNGPVETVVGASPLVWIRGFDLQSHPLWSQIPVGIGYGSSIAMDGQDNFLVTWTSVTIANPPDTLGVATPGVFGIMAQLEDYTTSKPLSEPVVTRPLFRLNSASTTPLSTTDWAMGQGDSSAAVDLDGDLAVAYDGFGPDVSENPNITSALFEPYFDPVNGNPTINLDLLPYFNPFAGQTLIFGSILYSGETAYTIDQAIDQVLFQAQYETIPAATTEQLGRLRVHPAERGRPTRGRGPGRDAVAMGHRSARYAGSHWFGQRAQFAAGRRKPELVYRVRRHGGVGGFRS